MRHGWLGITMAICRQPDRVRAMSCAHVTPSGKFYLLRRRQKRCFPYRPDPLVILRRLISRVTRICFYTNIPTRVRLSLAYLADIHKNDSLEPLMSTENIFSFGVVMYPVLPHKVCNALKESMFLKAPR